MCQCHHNKQAHNMSTRARARVSKYHINVAPEYYTNIQSPTERTRTTTTTMSHRIKEQKQINKKKNKEICKTMSQQNITTNNKYQWHQQPVIQNTKQTITPKLQEQP